MVQTSLAIEGDMTAPRASESVSGADWPAGSGRGRGAGWSRVRRIGYGAGLASEAPTVSGHSRYVGCLSALVVGLGVVAAIVSMPAIALAGTTSLADSTGLSSSAGAGSNVSQA